MRNKKQPTKRDLYQEVTDKILAMLDRGVAPWRHPIRRRGGGDGNPKSLASGKRYRGINTFLLAITGWAEGYESTYWATFNQIKKRGGSVRKGEKSTLVVFWKQAALTDKVSGEERSVPVLRRYHVFNAEQCDGVEAPDTAPVDEHCEPFTPIEEAERIATSYSTGPLVRQTGSMACYFPESDTIRIPSPERFESRESYYATLFHEYAHSTGHPSRLNRLGDRKPSPFGTADYCKEELVAEMGSAFLCAAAGIGPSTVGQSASYIDGWRRKLREDKRLVIQAAGQGQRAADHVRGVTFEAKEPTQEV